VPTRRSWDSAYERKAIVLLTLSFGLVGLDRWVLPPLFPAMMIELHLNYKDLGNLVGVLGITWGVSSIVMGGLSDRIGHKRVLVPAVAVFSLLSAFSGMATGLVSLLLARAIMGAAEDWLRQAGIAKLQLMVRSDNKKVQAFYESLDYDQQERIIDILKNARQPMFLVCVSDQAKRLNEVERKPARMEPALSARRARIG